MALHKRKVQKQPLELFCKRGILKHFAKFTGKHLWQSLFFNKVAGVSLRTTASEGILRMRLISVLSSEKTSYFNIIYCIFIHFVVNKKLDKKGWLYKFICDINLFIENESYAWLSDQRDVTEIVVMKSLMFGFHYGLTRINKS